ncbi:MULTISPECIES: hypothetical protein [Streptomyces]|uniref:DUF1682 domain-containing protein n=1 Tax=Streptomyces doudnae TaxID=3075536 RepID=A0ABD5EWG6_9ACTN|nr:MULTISPECIES: hypothetical protein [unclassified Streptomyces]MDT0438679.1 hypothetical protein [Streptomyces sp. DSM 41981]MYQ62019.1 hypothetical protein [Streptomyces sp. SID4950]SCD28609.1 hypothetical protein GA0115242_10071 [Streptomyces sp. SolWspMP-5a-2]
MNTVRLAGAVAAALGIWVLWRRHRYPGGWAFAFSFQYETDRERLANARSKARHAARTAAQTESTAQAQLTSAKADYDRRLDQLAQKIAALRNPGTGERLGSLGELALFRHALVVTSSTDTRSIALADLDVSFDKEERIYSIYITQVTGHRHRVKYPHFRAPLDDQPLFDHEAVSDFVIAIQNAVADENNTRARIPHQLKEAERELEDARADTRAQEAARRRLAQVRQRNRQDPDREAAEDELERARLAWKKLTGRMPPR